MKILIIGGGAREHAICDALAKSPKVKKVYCAPGNGGIESAEILDIKATDFETLADFAERENIDLSFCPMDEPLVLGIADIFKARGLGFFGPSAAAAHIEGSKAYAKKFMKKYNIPTADYNEFEDFETAVEFVKNAEYPLVIKADGLALGKGVLICHNFEDARAALKDMFVWKKFGKSGEKIVIEKYLTGVECSILAFCDGQNFAIMPSAKDHKQIYDGDKGPNTGGMGVVVPNPYYTADIDKICHQEIFAPTLTYMKEEGREFVGILFFGLMLTADGPKVIEYNCRPGDPEMQTILGLLETDLVDIILACQNKNLDKLEISWKNKSIVNVVAASKGYPDKYETGFKIDIEAGLDKDIRIYYAGAKKEAGALLTAGGRVLNVVAIAEEQKKAAEKVYTMLDKVRFDGVYFRRDIGI